MSDGPRRWRWRCGGVGHGLAVLACCAAVSGCVADQPMDLRWLKTAQTRETVRARLGEPAHYLDRDTLMAWRICHQWVGMGPALGGHHEDKVCTVPVGAADWSLLVQFDARGAYLTHRLVSLGGLER